VHDVSTLYKSILSAPMHETEVKLDVAGIEYRLENIVSCVVSGELFDSPGIGNCVARKITLEIYPLADIPRQAKIKVFARVVSEEAESEWVPKGVFYISIRKLNEETGVLTITGYDAMLMTEQVWLTSEFDSTNFPMTESDAINSIASRIGVDIDDRINLTSTAKVNYPVDENGDLTMREVLRNIAVANAGNWIITDEGSLLLIQYGAALSEPHTIGKEVESLSVMQIPQKVTRINLVVDENAVYTSGDDSGATMEKACLWGTQEMADSILETVGSVTYIPFTAKSAFLDPSFEIGDAVIIGDITAIITTATTAFDKMCLSDISAPASDEIDDEYPNESSTARSIERKIAYNRSLITKSSEEIRLEVENVDGRVSTLSQTVDGLKTRVSDIAGDVSTLEQTAASIEESVSDLDSDVSAKLALKIDKSDNDQVVSMINASANKIDLESDELTIKSGQFSLEKGVATFRGSVKASDNSDVYMDMASSGLNIYMPDGTIVGQIGYTVNQKNGWIYPYMVYGRGNDQSGTSGLIKKFDNGFWFGTSGQKDSEGEFSPQSGDYGFFVDIMTGSLYAVINNSMQNLYTGDAIARFG
jgi:hypothetical protein